MAKKALIAIGLLVALLWMLWWWSLGFPAQVEVCEAGANGAKECNKHAVAIGWIWIFVAALDRYGVLLTAIATVAIAGFTYILYRATNALVMAEQQKRSIVRGAGRMVSTDVFEIQASNSGEGAAILSLIRWGFAEFGEVPPVPAYERQVPSGESLFPRQQYTPVRYVRLREGLKRPVIFCQFTYFDVSRKKDAVYSFAMDIRNPEFPLLPAFTREMAPDYWKDTFSLKAEKD